jgi:cytochrome d ubiquinol oxidase subunit I
MQRPAGYTVSNGRAQLTNVWHLLDAKWTLWAFGHTMLAALTTGATVVFGVACWHLVRRRNQDVFMRAAKLALIVLVPVSALNLWFGSNFGIVVTQQQPMKIAAVEGQWDTCTSCAFSLFQIGGFSQSDPTPSFSVEIPGLLSFLATGSFHGTVTGINELQAQEVAQHGPGNYIPPVGAVYWSMRAMAYLGTIVFLVAIVGGYLYRRKRLERTRWFLWTSVATIAVPFLAALSGWVLTEVGRQPWIVYGLLRTADAVSPNTTVATVGTSLAVFGALYGALAVVDFVLMRRYARLDPPDVEGGEEAAGAVPAIGY